MNKQTPGINTFYIDAETKTPITIQSRGTHDVVAKCKPDMDWIINKCMMKSEDYRKLLELNSKKYYHVQDPYILKQTEILEKLKKRPVNTYLEDEKPAVFNNAVMNPVFNNCALLYQDLCRTFYETKNLEEVFRLD